MKEGALAKPIQLLLFITLAYLFLVTAKPFLVPVVFAAIFAMVLLPISMKLEEKGMGRGFATLLSILVLVIVVCIIGGLLAWQVSEISKQSDQLEKNIAEKFNELRQFANKTLGISQQKQEEIIEEQKASSNTMINSLIKGSLLSIGSALTNVILILVYIFMFMYFRSHLKKFVMIRVDAGKQAKAKEMMQSGRKVAHKYLTGLAMMIAALWVMYGIGFTIAGVKNSYFFAIICGLLEIVPFVGNLAGVV
ncbi:MAG: AI-2E family transporter, partial [Flavisolibacter sp.]|nr:AI-2E family transporter [Flavisolibacter sp.]